MIYYNDRAHLNNKGAELYTTKISKVILKAIK